MLEWLKRHAWKACSRQKRHGGSNPPLSAKQGLYRGFTMQLFFYCRNAGNCARWDTSEGHRTRKYDNAGAADRTRQSGAWEREANPKGGISRFAKMRKPQCTDVHEDFRIKRNAESTLLSWPLPFIEL